MYFPTGFDRTLAVELGGLVQGAYDQYEGKGPNWPLKDPPYGSPMPLFASPTAGAKREIFGFITRRQGNGPVYVVFRGTQSPADWVANLEFKHVKHPWGNVEAGFSEIYGPCSETVLSALRTMHATAPLRKVYVTGHSLGGALATLCAADLAVSGVAPDPAVYTFASPRVGDPAFATRFNQACHEVWRVVNTEDIVNTVPLATPLAEILRIPKYLEPAEHLFAFLNHLNYEHVGTPVDFTQHNGNIIGNHQLLTYLGALNASA